MSILEGGVTADPTAMMRTSEEIMGFRKVGSNVRFRFYTIESCEILKCILSDSVLER